MIIYHLYFGGFHTDRNGRKDWVTIFLINRNTIFYNWKYAEYAYDLYVVYRYRLL
jgi:hypothetical protein